MTSQPFNINHSFETNNLLSFARVEIWMSPSFPHCLRPALHSHRGSVLTQNMKRTRRAIPHCSQVTTIKRHPQICMSLRDARQNGQEPGGEDGWKRLLIGRLSGPFKGTTILVSSWVVKEPIQALKTSSLRTNNSKATLQQPRVLRVRSWRAEATACSLQRK